MSQELSFALTALFGFSAALWFRISKDPITPNEIGFRIFSSLLIAWFFYHGI